VTDLEGEFGGERKSHDELRMMASDYSRAAQRKGNQLQFEKRQLGGKKIGTTRRSGESAGSNKKDRKSQK